jgi:hypothetical protein
MRILTYALVAGAFLVCLFLASQLAVDIKLHREWGTTVVAWIGWFIVLWGVAWVAGVEKEIWEIENNEPED